MNWRTISSEYITRHPYFSARKDVCETPGGKSVEAYYVVELGLTACALAITADEQVILVRQYRHPVEQIILELPGGFVDKGETSEQAIARELMEETGYAFTSYEEVGEVAANPGVLNNFTKLYLARGGHKVAEQQLDNNEEIEVILVPLDELMQMFMQNKIVQSLHACCIMYSLIKMGKLHFTN